MCALMRRIDSKIRNNMALTRTIAYNQVVHYIYIHTYIYAMYNQALQPYNTLSLGVKSHAVK